MNLDRVNSLAALLSKLRKQLSAAEVAKDILKTILPDADGLGRQSENLIRSAISHTQPLESFGMSAAFLEDIMTPVREVPDCSGIASAVQVGIHDKEEEMRTLKGKISYTEAEKAQAEAEE